MMVWDMGESCSTAAERRVVVWHSYSSSLATPRRGSLCSPLTPTPRCYFLAYEYLVQRYTASNNITREQISPLVSLGFGASAGFALWFSIYPIDVVKSKLQTDALDPAKRQYKGMLDCFGKTWRAQGVKGFLGGLEPTLVRSPFANGATFVAFELAMRAMGSEEKVDAPPDLIV